MVRSLRPSGVSPSFSHREAHTKEVVRTIKFYCIALEGRATSVSCVVNHCVLKHLVKYLVQSRCLINIGEFHLPNQWGQVLMTHSF